MINNNAAISQQDGILKDIHLPDKNIAIHQREIEHLTPEIKRVMQHTFDFSVNGTPEAITAALNTYFNTKIQGAEALLKDVLKLTNLFHEVAKAPTYRLLLVTVNTNMCRRFHTDMNDLRLLCTYSGPGTLWLTEININRNALTGCNHNACIVIDENEIQQVKTGSTVILKGAIYPKEGTKAVVHRSPTIEESGEKRLLLRIDTNDFLTFE